MRIEKTSCGFEREPLNSPFGFKGGYLTELWQAIALVRSADGTEAVGLGTQSVLWSDSAVFAGNSEAAGNGMMFLMTAKALKLAEGIEWDNPIDLFDTIFNEVYEYGKRITCNPSLRPTFAANSMVAVDNAVWMLYCAEKGIASFDDMVPGKFREALPARHQRLANVPLMSYNVPIEKISDSLKGGYFLLKIKIGADPDGDGDLDKMLEWDKRRVSEIHAVAKHSHTPYTDTGRIPYYLDANGRYDGRDRLMRLLDHCADIGALENIVIIEEPFPEHLRIDVADIPVRVAADESAHSDRDAQERIELGYKAVALKPIAKTMSMSLKIAKVCHDAKVPCFCADLTVNPILVDWNKNVAARLPALPGVKIGVCESNGSQNYRNWEAMKACHPCAGASWIEPHEGVYILDDTFFEQSGGILQTPLHYRQLCR
ncbi:MAG: hypothetical protein JW808_03735 [Victivallales bacterium]|nr:hypothetical protein [Victivallales bacterium]